MVRPHWVIGFNVSARLVWPPLLALKQVRSSAATRWLQGVVGQIHSRISFLQTTPILEDAVRLDPKEATYLRWIAVGMTMEEMADVEGVKYNSVRVKLCKAMKRFDVRSKAHLTALAIRRKLM